MHNTLIWVIVLVIIIVAVFFFYQRANAPTRALDTEHIATEIANGEAVLLDVRTDEELASDGYALGSTHFDIVRLEDGELPDISKDTKVYTYCAAGGRASKAETILEEAGYGDVENIGGLSDWESAGGTIVRQ